MKNNIKLFNSISFRNKESLKGYAFFIPLLFGIVTFFIIPVIKSFLFSVSDVTSGQNGYQIDISGFSAYYDALFRHTKYRQTVVSSMIEVLSTTPLIIVFSFFMASVLNQNFRGKLFFRVILFLPLVLTVMNTQTNTLESAMGAFSSYKGEGEVAVSFTNELGNLLLQSGLDEGIVDSINGLVNSIYNIISKSAIQILIMLVGMQAISPALYEAATVEGATAWESFWKITFPMLCPMIVVCVIYTIIDTFTADSNLVITLMTSTAFTELNLSLASAMGWLYFFTIAILLCIVAWLFSRLIKYYGT